jgi:hypothetical protein
MLLMSHNLFHRGARRHHGTEEENALPRFFFRFMCYRTTDPSAPPPLATATPIIASVEQVSRRFRLTPLQYWLLTPELQ